MLKDYFLILDNNPGGSPEYLHELCNQLAPLKKKWGCGVSFNILKNKQLVKNMSRAGCVYTYIGLETFNASTLNSMNKKQNLNILNEIKKVLPKTNKIQNQTITYELWNKLPMLLLIILLLSIEWFIRKRKGLA